MAGTIHQKLYVKGLPTDVTMTVTALNLLPPSPPKEWRTILYGSNGLERKAPFVVKPSVDNGFIGKVTMYGAHAFPTGPGARLEIMFKLTGNSVNQTGRILVETTDWGYVERPDYVYVFYQIADKTPNRVISKIASTIIDMPEDALFVIGLGKNGNNNELGINATQDTDVANNMASYALKGISWAHKKAFGWIFGKL